MTGNSDLVESSIWISRFSSISSTSGSPNTGARLAVKDSIDVAGVATTLGNAVIASQREPATVDATCVARLRAAGATLMGKTNLNEFCFGTNGVNADFGTPDNPQWPAFVPGGSSSGSAVAVATGEADIGLGTDTAGSVRIPAACCGIVGLKLTNGAVPMDGVWQLSPTLDSLGLLAKSTKDLPPWLQALGVRAEPLPTRKIGVFNVPGVASETVAVVSHALRQIGLPVIVFDDIDWQVAARAVETLVVSDAHRAISGEGSMSELGVSWDIRARLDRAGRIGEGALEWAQSYRATWRGQLDWIFDQVDILAVPTLLDSPPKAEGPYFSLNRLTGPVNLAGLPAIVVPLTSAVGAPISVQLIARAHEEGRAIAIASWFEEIMNNSEHDLSFNKPPARVFGPTSVRVSSQ